MPVTQWSEIAGEKCLSCGEWATHWYGVTALCCECHGGNICSPEQATQAHKAYAFGLVEDEVVAAISSVSTTDGAGDVRDLATEIVYALSSVIDIEKVFQFLQMEETDAT